MWLATLILLGITATLALWGWDEKTRMEQLESRRDTTKRD